MIFPLQVWKQIFLNLDPIDLINFESVCRSWKELIESILQESTLWEKMCKSNISPASWDSLIEKLYPHKPYVSDKNDQISAETWKNIWKLWRKHKQLIECDIEIEILEPLPAHRTPEIITCARVSGEFLAVGTSEGYVYVYEFSNNKKCLIWVIDHKEHVCDIQFIRNEASNFIATNSINHHIKLWDIKTKSLLQKGYGKLSCGSHGFYYVTRQNNLIVSRAGNIVNVFETMVQEYTAITATANKVCLYSNKGHFIKMTFEEQQETCTEHFISLPPYNIRRYYLFKNDILACITEDSLLGISVQGKEWKMHNVFPYICSVPTTVLIFLNLLILGSDSGDLSIFYVEDFDDLDFKSLKEKRVALGSTAIVALEVMVYLGELYLVAANYKYIFLLKFN